MKRNIKKFVIYMILGIVSFFCLFWFYALFINATRSNAELSSGFSLLPGTALIKNWNSMKNCALPVMNSMKNSLFVSLAASFLCSYFSIMTASSFSSVKKREIQFLMLQP